jgi:hypothetical protein
LLGVLNMGHRPVSCERNFIRVSFTSSVLHNKYIKWLDVFINFAKKDTLNNVRGNLYCPCKHYKNEKKYHIDDSIDVTFDQVRIPRGLSMLE